MIDLLKQPPHFYLDLELCRGAYGFYRNDTQKLFTLPEFETRFEGRLEGILGSVSQSFGDTFLFPTVGEAAKLQKLLQVIITDHSHEYDPDQHPPTLNAE